MAKKKMSQTEELSRARWEFLKRNTEALQEYNESELIQSFRVFCKERGLNAEEAEKESMALPAANAHYAFIEFSHKHPEFFTEPMPDQELNEKFLDILCQDARYYFRLLTNDRPFDHLLLGINLSRSKEAIMAEVETLVTEWQHFYRGGEPPKKRLKWLRVLDDLLAVWDRWVELGEPARQAFPKIAKTLNIPESTVKARWYRAYELIYGKPFQPDLKYRTEGKVESAEKKLCAKCPFDAVCYKNKNGDWIPCPAYLKIAGAEKTSADLLEYQDGLLHEKSGRKKPKKNADNQ